MRACNKIDMSSIPSGGAAPHPCVAGKKNLYERSAHSGYGMYPLYLHLEKCTDGTTRWGVFV